MILCKPTVCSCCDFPCKYFLELNFPLPPPDVDAGCGYWHTANILPADVFRQLKGRNTLQLGEGAHHRHLLTHTEETQAHDHYYYYYY